MRAISCADDQFSRCLRIKRMKNDSLLVEKKHILLGCISYATCFCRSSLR